MKLTTQFQLVCKGIPRQAEVALVVPGRLRHRIFSTFGTTRVVGRQPYALAAFTPGEIPGTHFQRLSRSQGTWFCRKEPRKKFQVTPPGIDPGTVRLVAQRLKYYATPGPTYPRSSALRTGRLYPRRNLWYSFSEAQSTSGHMVLSEGTTEKIQSDTTGDRSRDRPTSSAAP